MGHVQRGGQIDTDGEVIANLIAQTAYRIYRRYRRWIEAEDLRQEMWTYVATLSNRRLKEITEQTFIWRLRDCGEAYARREKAQKSGYSPDDEVFYGLRVIRELLPYAVLGVTPTLRGERDRDRPTARRAGATPPLEFETAVVDVRRAYASLPAPVRRLLAGYVAGEDTAEGEAMSALRALQRRLGGRRPQVIRD